MALISAIAQIFWIIKRKTNKIDLKNLYPRNLGAFIFFVVGIILVLFCFFVDTLLSYDDISDELNMERKINQLDYYGKKSIQDLISENKS